MVCAGVLTYEEAARMDWDEIAEANYALTIHRRQERNRWRDIIHAKK